MSPSNVSSLLLRFGIAFVFLYPAFAAFSTPNDWIGFFPPSILEFGGKFIPEVSILHLFSAGEIVIGVWLISGWKIAYAATLAALILATITLTNLGAFDIIFRDVGLSLAALALAFFKK